MQHSEGETRIKRGERGTFGGKTLEEYMEWCAFSEDTVGLYIHWDDAALDAFVQRANELADKQYVQPEWVSSSPGSMTSATFKRDVINYFDEVGGGSYGTVLVAPNTVGQVLNVAARVTRSEREVFVQEAMAEVPAEVFLASFAIIYDAANLHGTPWERDAPEALFRRVFA